MKRAAIAVASLALITVGIASAQDQGSTLITAQWDSGAPPADGGAPPATSATTGAADAGAVTTDGGGPTAPAVPADQSKSAYRGNMDEYYHYFGLDIDLQGGGGYFWGENKVERGIAFGRVRGGVLYATWPFIYAIGATFEANNLSPLNFGLQVEATHLGAGIWAQLGGSVDWKGQPAGMLSLGWSIFGVEGQIRSYKDALDVAMPSNYGVGFQLVGKVRIPIGFILYVLNKK